MAQKTTGVIFDIKKYAIHDGPGIRTTIFFKGCPLRCWWCHNPEGQKFEPEIINEQNTTTLITSKKEIIGREVSVGEVMAEIKKDQLFYDESGGGVTFSGGEPLTQPDFLNELIDACWEQDIKTTLDTCGYAPWKTLERIKDKIHLILYDIKIINDKEHQKYTGVSNKLILSNFEKLMEEGKNIIIRFPVISGITDTEENIDQLEELFIKWLQKSKKIEKREINLLPYHDIAKGKYQKLSLPNRLVNLKPPSAERLSQLTERFRSIGFKVKIGG